MHPSWIGSRAESAVRFWGHSHPHARRGLCSHVATTLSTLNAGLQLRVLLLGCTALSSPLANGVGKTPGDVAWPRGTAVFPWSSWTCYERKTAQIFISCFRTQSGLYVDRLSHFKVESLSLAQYHIRKVLRTVMKISNKAALCAAAPEGRRRLAGWAWAGCRRPGPWTQRTQQMLRRERTRLSWGGRWGGHATP